MKIVLKTGGFLGLLAVVVPHICDPVQTQPIAFARGAYQHLANLELADPGETSGELEVDLLVGCDHYWSIVTGRVIRGPSGSVATETQFGWVLSGPIQGTFEDTMTLSVVSTSSTHLLRVDTTHDTSTL